MIVFLRRTERCEWRRRKRDWGLYYIASRYEAWYVPLSESWPLMMPQPPRTMLLRPSRWDFDTGHGVAHGLLSWSRPRVAENGRPWSVNRVILKPNRKRWEKLERLVTNPTGHILRGEKTPQLYYRGSACGMLRAVKPGSWTSFQVDR